MEPFGNIVVFHPAAIGDAVLASPVAATLKLNYPAAKITYWTHKDLRQLLLGLCPSVDEVVDYDREAGIIELIKTARSFQADLFVDLAGSFKSLIMGWFTKGTVLRYEKMSPSDRSAGVKHAVANFMDTIRPVCPEIPDKLFPSVFPEALAMDLLERHLEEQQLTILPMIGIVPGVGKVRPHRAWLYEGWQYLIHHILEWNSHLPVLIGGPDEVELCRRLNEDSNNACLNVSGVLSLPETAAVLKACEVVISGDTGPAHLAVAVGTRVIGLYGPTFPERSGPYGCLDLVLDQSENCQCLALKQCTFANPGEPGRCMQRIMLPEVLEKLRMVGLGSPSFVEPPPVDDYESPL